MLSNDSSDAPHPGHDTAALPQVASHPPPVLTSASLHQRSHLSELWSQREVAHAFASRTLRLRYKQAILGVAWALLQPAFTLLLFAFVFGRIAHLSGGGVPYAVFALATLVVWQFLSNSLTIASTSLLNEAPLVRKVYFARELPIIASLAVGLVDLGAGLLLYFLLAPFLGAHLGLALLYLPIVLLPLVLLALALALPLAALNVYYRDIRYALPLATQVWLFLSPVAYPLGLVPSRWRTLYTIFNPASGTLDSVRRVLTLNTPPHWTLFLISLLEALVLLPLGAATFSHLAADFADVI